MSKKEVIALALYMYANEPCRICGENITLRDAETSVFAGYSSDNKARAAHLSCWRRYPAEDNTPRPEWVHQ